MDRRLVDALRAASDALRAAAHALEEFGDERGPSYREDFERREREYRGSDSDRRDWGPDSRSRQDDDEPREAEGHPPLPPMPPYPPFPPTRRFRLIPRCRQSSSLAAARSSTALAPGAQGTA